MKRLPKDATDLLRVTGDVLDKVVEEEGFSLQCHGLHKETLLKLKKTYENQYLNSTLDNVIKITSGTDILFLVTIIIYLI